MLMLDRSRDATTPCNCYSCVKACTFVPGWFLPGEAEEAASLLKMSFHDFFNKYLVVNWFEGEGVLETVFVLSPAVIGAPTGTEAPADPRGTCVFFQPETLTCKIFPHHPYECAAYYHDQHLELLRERHRLIADAWKGHQDYIKELLGREPQEKQFDLNLEPQSLGQLLFNKLYGPQNIPD